VTLSFCACFDDRDLARGVLMLRSLRAHCHDARISVLAGSELCRQVLETLALPAVTVIGLEAVEAAFPALVQAKAAGSPACDIAALTPFLLQYCFDRDPTLARIALIDASLYFYGDPAPVFAGVADKSVVLLAPHSAPEFAEHLRSGVFAQGWISVARAATSLAGLADPQPAALDRGMTVDDEPLIFCRFDGVRPLPDGNFEVSMPPSDGDGEIMLRRQIYRPYLARLIAEQQALQAQFPDLRPVPARRRRGEAEQVEDEEVALTLAPDGWRPELGDGWRLDLVTRRRLLDDYQELKAPPAAALVRRHIAALGPGPVSVLEYGGGLGVLAEACLASGAGAPAVDWHLLELPSVCDHGRVLRPDIRFIDDADAAFSRRYDLVLQCDALQYQRDWSGFLHRLAAAARFRLLLLEVPVIAGSEDLAVLERPRAFGFRHAMQSWLIAEARLKAALAATGLSVIGAVPGRPAEKVPGAPPVTLVGYVLARSGS
jgi:putative methyltransferase (TIGR04325 family)